MNKTLKFISVTVAILATVTLSAKDGKSERNYGPYATAGAKSNWFITVGGGADYVLDGVLSGGNKGKFSPNFDLMFGKWVTPTVGARFGYSGLTDSVDGNKNFWNHYVHADVLWNVSNQFWGYKDRVYNLVPYGHTGVYLAGNRRCNLAGGIGFINNFKVHKNVSLFIDLRATATRGVQFYGEGFAGVVGATQV